MGNVRWLAYVWYEALTVWIDGMGLLILLGAGWLELIFEKAVIRGFRSRCFVRLDKKGF